MDYNLDGVFDSLHHALESPVSVIDCYITSNSRLQTFNEKIYAYDTFETCIGDNVPLPSVRLVLFMLVN